MKKGQGPEEERRDCQANEASSVAVNNDKGLVKDVILDFRHQPCVYSENNPDQCRADACNGGDKPLADW
jgi:hypothetical protein